jgi:glycerophosphoryl diester phosphodiesterase
VLGHRGLRGDVPENTLLAFDSALEQGAAGVELDVRLSLDGAVVVHHDPDLRRMTQGRCLAHCDRLSMAALKSHDLGLGQRIPTLAEVLFWRAQHDCLLNVELKRDVPDRKLLVRAVARTLVAAAAAPERVLLSSFDPGIVRHLTRALPGFPIAYLVGEGFSWPPAGSFRMLGASFVNPIASRCSPFWVARLKQRGALIAPYGVDDGALALALAKMGVDGVISDYPGRVSEALKEGGDG